MKTRILEIVKNEKSYLTGTLAITSERIANCNMLSTFAYYDLTEMLTLKRKICILDVIADTVESMNGITLTEYALDLANGYIEQAVRTCTQMYIPKSTSFAAIEVYEAEVNVAKYVARIAFQIVKVVDEKYSNDLYKFIR